MLWGGEGGGVLERMLLHIGVFTPSLGTREYLPVNNSLRYKTQIVFLQR
jgi:hypothetical protein